MQKSNYNYTKKTALTHSAWLMAGPGIVTVVGKQKFMRLLCCS